MEIALSCCAYVAPVCMNGCIWYTFFNWCGCIDNTQYERETIPATPIQKQKQPNPFIDSSLPKDTHLHSAYT
jgi:hypothetical protein